jgi:hypothetical protein
MRPLAAAPLAGGRIENGTDELAVRVHYKLGEIGKKYDANVNRWLSPGLSGLELCL